MTDIERVREQYLDTDTGQLVWVSTEEAAEVGLRSEQLMALPPPYAVSGSRLVLPYVPFSDRVALLTAEVDLGYRDMRLPNAPGYRTAHLRKTSVTAGPYLVRVWELG